MMNDPLGDFDFRGKKTAIVSLGCARNTVDSQVFLREARRRGAVICPPEDACVVMINTCGFTREAKEESLGVIAEWLDHKKKRKVENVLVLGCLAQRYRKDIREGYKDIDVVGGLVQEADGRDLGGSPVLLTPRHYAYLKISEGCDNRCAYCAIPLIKGRSRSRSEAEIIAEAVRLERCGVRELNIVGQDITLYGCDGRKKRPGRTLRPGLPLVGLVEKILRATSIPWIRLMYLHPQRVGEDVMDLLGRQKRLCPYVDLPLQHINDRILKHMGRPTTRRDIVRLISGLRKKVASLALRTTFIVGFPGETKKEFRELLEFVRETRFDKLGAFMFSREEGTRAYACRGQVPQKEKQRRYHDLMEMQKGISLSLLEKKIGMTTQVLVEETTRDRRMYLARTPWDAPEVDGLMYLTSSRKLEPGQIVGCRITDAFEYDLAGETL
ncbi:MAG: 30S ribosomal protein S12 methylthiotransferase RimO [Candidatus Omnitrophota bacterium]|jgi:ribosomal protein S12 methylthiotransferase|nr:30S ribosomal protein S12 methylthiotransferase RimO [Candidatus Omnitrophota bacterium]MDD5137275.1 30S ribosomal protein S12 methylthiotransferase RimO [Candidatus Omnitrophota bacterium]MDD5537964.1 30S ribosomal protein S12 methylthiotransferase RimO [Candidatus Omnitrophota bacterium]